MNEAALRFTFETMSYAISTYLQLSVVLLLPFVLFQKLLQGFCFLLSSTLIFFGLITASWPVNWLSILVIIFIVLARHFSSRFFCLKRSVVHLVLCKSQPPCFGLVATLSKLLSFQVCALRSVSLQLIPIEPNLLVAILIIVTNYCLIFSIDVLIRIARIIIFTVRYSVVNNSSWCSRSFTGRLALGFHECFHFIILQVEADDF